MNVLQKIYHLYSNSSQLAEFTDQQASDIIKKDMILSKMSNLSGFYPSTKENIIKFSELMMNDMKQVDILGTWRKEEKLFAKDLNLALKIRLQDLEPYYHESPWSESLINKTVLVIHPFEESIISQYK